MRIQWEPLKNEWLKKHRGISFEPICEKISSGEIIGVFANPSPKYPHQGVFIVEINDYTWVVPFRDTGDSVNLITAFPSRKAHKKHGGKI